MMQIMSPHFAHKNKKNVITFCYFLRSLMKYELTTLYIYLWSLCLANTFIIISNIIILMASVSTKLLAYISFCISNTANTLRTSTFIQFPFWRIIMRLKATLHTTSTIHSCRPKWWSSDKWWACLPFRSQTRIKRRKRSPTARPKHPSRWS